MTIHWKAVEQYFTVVLFVFQFYPVCNFGKFIKFGLALSEVNLITPSNKSETNTQTGFLEIAVFLPRCFLMSGASKGDKALGFG